MYDYNQSNLGKILTAKVTYYDEIKKEPVTEKVEWVEGVNVINSQLILSFRQDGHEMIDKPYDVKNLRTLILF